MTTDDRPPAARLGALTGATYGDEWWRHAVIYQIYPRSFADTDGDGIGDLPGIRSHLDHAVDLGADAIWLSPIYPSPGLDVGYDVADHTAVDPVFGTEADFDQLVADAHGRGLRVILDLVMNHTSDQHAWFQASRASREGPFADWYLWRDPAGFDDDGTPQPPNNWLSFFGGSGWQYDEPRQQFYMHTFLVEQPELNWRNPEVEAAQWQMVRGWLDRGVDGFRLDVFNAFLKHPELLANPAREGESPWDRQEHIHDRDSPDFPELIARFRSILDEQPGRMSVGELFASEPERAPALFADRHLVFDWGLLAAPWSAEAYAAAIDGRERYFGEDRWLANVLSNHDQSRQATRLAASAGIDDTDAVARAAAVVLLTLRGTPFLYYGEELGTRDVPVPDDRIIDPPARRALVDPDFQWWNRDLCRSPIPWTPDANGHGFTTGSPWLPFGDDASVRNVETESADPGSVLSTYRRLIGLRRSTDALRTGRFRRVELATPDVLSYLRETATERVFVVVDFAGEGRTVDLSGLGTRAWRPVGGTHVEPSTPGADGSLALRPLEAVILVEA
ncbi:MAG TPA: alpha-amylase family glycosyl hydrolase [Candidatus Saccharimonadales bacterium]|nr:alpha-amylase family glycosyl hydrolase [Candidatus Saccharimonadales bacterium]